MGDAPTRRLAPAAHGLDLGAELLVPALDACDSTVGAFEVLGDEVCFGEARDRLLVCDGVLHV